MASAQVARWARLNPTAKHTGHIFEVPLGALAARVGGIIAISGFAWWLNPQIFWVQKANTLDPEFQAEAKKIGNVAQRMNGPPVFLNPFRNRVPGNVTGPEDVKSALS